MSSPLHAGSLALIYQGECISLCRPFHDVRSILRGVEPFVAEALDIEDMLRATGGFTASSRLAIYAHAPRRDWLVRTIGEEIDRCRADHQMRQAWGDKQAPLLVEFLERRKVMR